MQDDRIISETGSEARVAAIVAPVIDAIGYRLVRVKLLNQDGITLQIMAERPDGTMTVDDCEQVSLAVSPALDVDDPIDSAYQLEISSPGIDRPLVRREDFANAVGQLARIETAVSVAGRKRFRGTIVAADEEGIQFERDKVDEGDEAVVSIPYNTMAAAKLILTDALIQQALKKDKQDRRDRKSDDEDGDEADDVTEH
ncbi:ribosome maturation factor RimP [Nitratireductor aestuarii]|uniref:Ribosome maturation factor RimP n=1 Tax=Nitratireductor aestuarii TaxID=1735103 RepID=A0A916RYP7_9HYPH|nr:ribosome maturation factor RimP [Nitratireductor aestuarii]GGA73295.1 ribosome maturation factor RimP [Nitratireductor aestuarii]